jgi:hypothetical protein
MKKISLLFILFSIAFVFSSCEVSRDFVFTFETGEQTAAAVDLSFSEVFNASSISPEFNRYNNEYGIEKLEISRIRYLITDFNGLETEKINSIQIQVADTNDTQPTDLASATDIVLANVKGFEQDMQMNSAGQSRMNELILNSPNEAKVYFSAEADEIVIYKVKLKIDLKATYKKSLF